MNASVRPSGEKAGLLSPFAFPLASDGGDVNLLFSPVSIAMDGEAEPLNQSHGCKDPGSESANFCGRDCSYLGRLIHETY